MNIRPEKYMMRQYRDDPPADGGEGGGGGGDGIPEWVQQLPEEFHEVKMLHQYKDLPSAIKGFQDTKQAVSQGIRLPSEEAGPEELAEFRSKLMEKDVGLVAIPGPDATPEEMAAFNKRLGVPEDYTAYEAPPVEGMELPPERLDFLRKTAHETGVTTKQFEKFMGKVLEADAKAVLQGDEERQRGVTALKNEWGDTFDHRLGRAGTFLENSEAPEALKEALKGNLLGAETLKWLDSLATRTGEKGGKGNDPLKDENGEDILTPDECRARADEIMKTLQGLADKGMTNTEEYKRLVQRRADYIKLANRS